MRPAGLAADGHDNAYTIEEASAITKVDPGLLWLLTDNGVILSFRDNYGERRVFLADVLAAIDTSPEGGWR